MAISTETNFNYNDFADLSRLRIDARKDSDAALKEVAKQFESVFVQMMIKSMREASVPLQGELFHGNESQAYTDMYDKQLGLELSKSNGIGLADVIVRQLSPAQGIEAKDQVPINSEIKWFGLSAPVINRSELNTNQLQEVNIKTSAVSDDAEFNIKSIHQSPHWSTPEDFIRDSWDDAKRAGKELGIDPRVIIAQSALETGWGKKVHVNENGENSYSLFGIKAGENWSGKKVQFNTLEFRSGVMNRERATFRAYDSLSESYQDYVKFLQTNPRYETVINADSSKEYSEQLQKSGYATDPNYSNKIERIRNGELMNNVLSELKLSVKESQV